MLRLMGAVLLLAASTALGFGAAAELREHGRELERLILSLEWMERELAGHLTPLPELLRRTAQSSQGRVRNFYALCAESLARREQQPFGALWRQAMEASQLMLDEDEQNLLAGLGDVLGRYDGDSQRRALCETAARLNERLSQARERSHRLGKVYGTLGVTAGAFLVIVLL